MSSSSISMNGKFATAQSCTSRSLPGPGVDVARGEPGSSADEAAASPAHRKRSLASPHRRIVLRAEAALPSAQRARSNADRRRCGQAYPARAAARLGSRAHMLGSHMPGTLRENEGSGWVLLGGCGRKGGRKRVLEHSRRGCGGADGGRKASGSSSANPERSASHGGPNTVSSATCCGYPSASYPSHAPSGAHRASDPTEHGMPRDVRSQRAWNPSRHGIPHGRISSVSDAPLSATTHRHAKECERR
jgi:hypothetical protein